MTPRLRELRRAWRAFWWQVVRRPATADLSRRVWMGIAFAHIRCGLVTGGEHWWGREYRRRDDRAWSRNCRLCRASTHRLDPMTTEDKAANEEWVKTHLVPAREIDVDAALASAAKAGIYRDGKFIWD